MKAITAEDFFYLISGVVYGKNAVVHYLKTYAEGAVHEERVKNEGKSTVTDADGLFSVRIRDQGVYGIYLFAEDPLTLCRSPIVTVPIFEASQSSSMHMWSPHLVFDNDNCLLSCTLSEPSDVFFLIEKHNGTNVRSIRSASEILATGFYAGSFAERAQFYIGSLESSGDYHSWLIMRKKDEISDVYSFDFTIPCPRSFIL